MPAFMMRRWTLLATLLATAVPLSAQSWCDRPPRPGYEALERVRVRDPWFHVYRLDEGTFALYEPDNFQEVISWLIVGRSRALLFDTGMGMSRIAAVVRELTRRPVTVVNSHSHYDHIGGNTEFGDIRSPDTEFTRRNAAGIAHDQVAQEVRPDALCRARMPTRFDTATYAIRPFRATGTLRDGTTFDLGGRTLEVIAVPGHTPDAIALLDRARGQLWTGDTFYPGPIWLYFPGTDLDAYDASMARLAALAPRLTRVFAGHNLPAADPAILPRVLERFRAVRAGAVPGEPKGEGLIEYPGDGFSFLMRAPEAARRPTDPTTSVPRDSTRSARTLARLVAQQERWMASANANLLATGEPKLPDLSTAAVHRAAERARAMVAALDSLVRDELTLDEWTTARLLRFEQDAVIDDARYHQISFAFITPYQSPLSSLPPLFARLPLTTAGETARYLAMLDSLPQLADTIIGKLEERRTQNVRLPRDEIRLIVPFVRSFAATAARSPFLPAEARLAQLPPQRRVAFLATVHARIDTKVRPGFERLAAYLEGTYRTEAPTRVGLAQYPDGEAYYRSLVRRSTTMDITPEQVHAIGLAEVARLDSLMAVLRARIGFTGTKAEFHAALAKDPRFFAQTPEAFGAKLMFHDARIRPRVAEVFAREPRARGDVRRLDPFLEASMTFGYYQVPTPQDSMGHYFYNGSNLPERSMLGAAALVFHELVPGHHFQLATQRETPGASTFRRMTTHTAFIEGWGEYAATLAGELGMYEDPYDQYGRLTMDIFLACRLVVDTGMNLLGWSRERAIAFLKAHTLQSDLQIDTETLRYAVDLPGQALAYKMGSRELMVLREEARTRLGTRFDITRWHAFVLDGGSLPLSVLRERQEAWIAEGGR